MTKLAPDADSFLPLVKRFLPFLIIVTVALLTVGIATTVYRKKVKPASNPGAAGSLPAAGTTMEEKEDNSLHVRGPRDAPVTMEVYGDFQCPSCASASHAIDELQKQYAQQLRVVFYEFPLAMHKHAVEAAMAAEAAGLQGKFWEMHDSLYQYQDIWSKVSDVSHFFEAYAESSGLDVARFRADRESTDVQARVKAEGDAGAARGVKNTPTIFVNGTEMRNGFTLDQLKETIDAALAAQKKS